MKPSSVVTSRGRKVEGRTRRKENGEIGEKDKQSESPQGFDSGKDIRSGGGKNDH